MDWRERDKLEHLGDALDPTVIGTVFKSTEWLSESQISDDIEGR
jgi:hypothetical protein